MASKKAPTPANIDFMEFLTASLNQAVSQAMNPREDTAITWEGNKIKLPDDPEKMPIRRAIKVLMDREAADTQEYDLFERIPGMPLDAAHAFAHVLKERYGYAAATTKMTIFGPQPPKMKQVKIGPNPEDYVEVPIGQFKLHDISTNIETGFTDPAADKKSQFMDFFIKATVDYKDRAVVMDLITATRDYMAKNSIYRGKALRLTVNGGNELDSLVEPIFMDLSKIDTNSLVLNDDVQHLLDVALTTPIKKTQAARKHKIPLKRGILLYGPYGTGKTLAAAVTARHAMESIHNWTYVMVDKADALAQTLEFARQFQPCVVFAEDIDRIVDLERSDEANDIINTVDNVLNKGDEVITVLTTNHIEKLPAVMLRPGRLDAIVPINLPDAKAAERLVRYYATDLLAKDVELSELGVVLADNSFIPAAIREVVERSKLSMLMDDRRKLLAEDLMTSALALTTHAKLLQKGEEKKSVAEEFGIAFRRLLDGHDGSSDLGEVSDHALNARRNASSASNYAKGALEEAKEIKDLVAKFAANGSKSPSAAKIDALTDVVKGIAAKVGAPTS